MLPHGEPDRVPTHGPRSKDGPHANCSGLPLLPPLAPTSLWKGDVVNTEHTVGDNRPDDGPHQYGYDDQVPQDKLGRSSGCDGKVLQLPTQNSCREEKYENVNKQKNALRNGSQIIGGSESLQARHFLLHLRCVHDPSAPLRELAGQARNLNIIPPG